MESLSTPHLIPPLSPRAILPRNPNTHQARPVLLALGQEPAIADVAARYLALTVPALFLAAASDTTRRYLLAQRVVLPGMAAAVATVGSRVWMWWGAAASY